MIHIPNSSRNEEHVLDHHQGYESIFLFDTQFHVHPYDQKGKVGQEQTQPAEDNLVASVKNKWDQMGL